MKLSILIATLGRRNDKFVALIDGLARQVKALYDQYPDEVEIIAYWNNGEVPISEIRRALIEQAKGEYVCFIDDDDNVPIDYCKRILDATKGDPDYVGFRVSFFNDGIEMPRVIHSIKYSTWHQDENGYYRGVTHLNPIKRSIAVQGDFGTSGNAGEDERWAKSVVHLVKTEEYIDEVMYFYYHSSLDTSFGGEDRPAGQYKRPSIAHKNFSYHINSKESS